MQWILSALLAVFSGAGSAAAQPVSVDPYVETSAPAPEEPLRLPAGTEVVLELAGDVSSAVVQRGDPFALRLAEPVFVDGRIVLPAGIAGFGEVIEAARHGVGGKPGKLILSARSLNVDGRLLPLRGWKVLSAGDARIGASVAVTIVIGFPGFFIKGKDAVAPAGARATAKTLEDFSAPSMLEGEEALAGEGEETGK